MRSAEDLRNMGPMAPPGDHAVKRMLREHMADDEQRFAALARSVSYVQGMLVVLIALVIGSGLLNWYQVH